jgi:hypothetical protein
MDKTLEETLEQAVKAWDDEEGERARTLLEVAVELMQKTGWM